MTDIKNRIEKIKEYFVGMNVQTLDDGTQAVYIIVKFPKKWHAVDNIMEKFGVTVQGVENNNYYFCTSLEDGFETLFNAIDYNVNVMKDAEERTKLLNEKISELEKIFSDETNTLDYLKTIEFNFKKKKKPIKKDTQKVENKEETKIEEI